MLKVYLTILGATWKKSGFSPLFLAWGFVLPLFRSLTYFTLFLDRIFFPGYRNQKIENPVFIIGCPRSGTTFLHRLLTQTREFSSFETWQLIFPSLTARVLVKPIVNYLIQKQNSKYMGEKIGHEISLNKIEHDEFLFMHELNTQARLLSPSIFEQAPNYPEMDLPDRQPEYLRKSSMDFFKGCLQRQMYYTGKETLIAQVHFSTWRIKTILNTFPDAKFLYLVRSPYETITSFLSFVYKGYKNKKYISSAELKSLIEKHYHEALDIYRYFYQLQTKKEIPENSFIVITYDRLCSSLENVVEEIVDFTGINLSQELQQVVKHQSQVQKNYKRKHQNLTLEELGFTKEQVAKDFSFVFEHYGFNQNPEEKLVENS